MSTNRLPNKLRRGDVWFFKPEVERPGHIQKGQRPVIIVSNNFANEHSEVVLAIPCTTQLKKNFPTHVMFVMNNTANVALAEQCGTVCVDELVDYKFTLPGWIMDQVDNALSIAFGLKPVPMTTITSPEYTEKSKGEPNSRIQKFYSRYPQLNEATTKEFIHKISKAPNIKSGKGWTVSKMKRFLDDADAGFTAKALSEKYGIGEGTVYNYKRRFKERLAEREDA